MRLLTAYRQSRQAGGLPEWKAGAWRQVSLSVAFAWLAVLLLCLGGLEAVAADTWNIGVAEGAAGSGVDWQTQSDYLAQRSPGRIVRVLELANKDMNPAIRTRAMDFLLAPPSLALMVAPAGMKPVPVATAKVSVGGGRWRIDQAGLLLVPASSRDIQSLADLAGKNLAVIGADDYAWLMVRREIAAAGHEPPATGTVQVLGNAEKVLQSLKSKQAAAGVVSTNDLSLLVDAGKTQIADWRVVNRQPLLPDFDMQRSTSLYPGLTLFAMPHVSGDSALQLQKILLSMPNNAPSLKGTCIVGWHLPIHDQQVGEMLTELELNPNGGQPAKQDMATLVDNNPVASLLALTALALAVALGITLVSSRHSAARREQLLTQDAQARNKLELCLASVMNLSEDGILFLDTDGSCLYANNAVTNLLGWTPAEMKNKPFYSLVRHAKPDGTPYSKSEDPDLSACQHGTAVQEDHLILRTKSDEELHVGYQAKPLSQQWKTVGAMVMFSDISAQLQEIEAVQIRLQKFEEELEADPTPILVMGIDGLCLEVNSAAVGFFGYKDKADFHGHTLAEFSCFKQEGSDAPAVEILNGYFGQLVADTPLEFPWRCLKADGEEADCYITMLVATPGVEPVIVITVAPLAAAPDADPAGTPA